MFLLCHMKGYVKHDCQTGLQWHFSQHVHWLKSPKAHRRVGGGWFLAVLSRSVAGPSLAMMAGRSNPPLKNLWFQRSVLQKICLKLAFFCPLQHLYSVFNLRLFLSFFYIFKNLVLKRQTETVNGTSICTLYLPFFMRVIPKGLTFEVCLYVLRL